MNNKIVKILFFTLLFALLPLVDVVNADISRMNDMDTVCFDMENSTHNSIKTSFVYRIFYMGKIDNLHVGEDGVSFDSINLFGIFHMRASDGNYWHFSISHYEDMHHVLEGYHSFGILTENIICRFFFKSY